MTIQRRRKKVKTRSAREILKQAFGYDSYAEFRRHLVEAKEPFPICMSWKCIAKGRPRQARSCIFDMQLGEDSTVDAHCVFENNSYIRFKGDDRIFRYINPEDMRATIKALDEDGQTDLEEGDCFTLEPAAKDAARSFEYQNARRNGIRDGTWIVKPRGPNSNMRHGPIHHYRPY